MSPRRVSRSSVSGSGASYPVAEGHVSNHDTNTNTNTNTGTSTAKTSASNSRAHTHAISTSPSSSNTNANTNSPKLAKLIRSPSRPVLRPPSPCPFNNNASKIPKPRLDQPHGIGGALDASVPCQVHGSSSSHANVSSKASTGGAGNTVKRPYGSSPSPSRSPSPSPSPPTSRKNPGSAYGGLLYPHKSSSSSASPPPSSYSSSASASANPRPRGSSRSPSPSPSPSRSASPSLSRTQLRHASAVRRLSSDGPGLGLGSGVGLGIVNENILPHNHYQEGNKPHSANPNLVSSPNSTPRTKAKVASTSTSESGKKRDETLWNGIQNRLANNLKGSTSFSIGRREGQFAVASHYGLHGLKRKGVDSAPDVPGLPMNADTATNTTLPPYLVKTLEVAGVGLMANSASMETLMDNREILEATFLTPQSVLEKMGVSDTYYHLWVAVRLALEELPVKQHATDEVVKLAFTKLLIELGSALNECLKPNLPHYTFVDFRKILLPDECNSIIEQAVAVVEGLEKKGVAKERVYVSIPASETGLAIAKKLRDEHGIKTNLVFVSGLTQTSACAAAGAAAITLSFDKILTYHELSRGGNYSDMNPHPGRQNIKASACFVKHHKLEMKVIASGLRWLEEIEHCSAVDVVCLNDNQVRSARWARMRVNRPPGPTSYIMSLAKAVPYPPQPSSSIPLSSSTPSSSSSTSTSSADKQGPEQCKYYSQICSPEERSEIARILHAEMRQWEEATEKLEGLIIREMERQMGLWAVDALEGETDLEDADVDVDMEVAEGGREQGEWARFERELKAQGALNPREAVLAVLEKLGKEKKISRSTAANANDSGSDEPLRGRSQIRTQTQRQLQYLQDRYRSAGGSRQVVGNLGVEFPRKASSLPSASTSTSTSSPRYRTTFDQIDENVLSYERGESLEPLSNVSVIGASSVPPSPYWTDAENFEDMGSSSEEDVDLDGEVEVDLGEEVDENEELGVVGDARTRDAMVLF